MKGIRYVKHIPFTSNDQNRQNIKSWLKTALNGSQINISRCHDKSSLLPMYSLPRSAPTRAIAGFHLYKNNLIVLAGYDINLQMAISPIFSKDEITPCLQPLDRNVFASPSFICIVHVITKAQYSEKTMDS